MYATKVSHTGLNTPITLRGQWDDNVSWEFHLSDQMPDASLCTAVYCLAILPHHDKVVLTRNHRGWEMLGGHIEPGEAIEQALIRECQEEGGFTPETYKLFGYRKITSNPCHTIKETATTRSQQATFPILWLSVPYRYKNRQAKRFMRAKHSP